MLLATLAFASGQSAFASAPTQSFYQSEFGPAVMLALGRGFVYPDPVPGGPLDGFLAGHTTTLEVLDVGVSRILEPDQFQYAHRYLLSAVGYWWRITGVSWDRLAEVAGMSHTLAVLSTFALLRLFVPWLPALIGGVWFASTPLQLGYAPHLRDFAKGAFVLAAVPFIVALVLRAKSRRPAIALGAGAGVVIGVGLGFKMDVAIMAPIAAACVLLFRDRRPWCGMRDKVLVLGALVLTLGITAWPVLSRLSTGGSNAVHVVLLGYSDWFDTRLGIEPGPYSLTPFYSDAYLRNVLRVWSFETTGQDAPMPSAAYDQASLDLWKSWLRTFPADAYTRLLAAVDSVLNLAFNNPGPTSVGSPWLTTVALGGFFTWLSGWWGWGWTLGAAAILAASYSGPGSALFVVALLLALAGYPSLQFDPRHYFHLQAIPIVIIVTLGWFVASWVVTSIRNVARKGGPDLDWPRPHWRPAASVLMASAVILAPVTVLRAYQSNQLTQQLSAFLQEDREQLDVEFVPLNGDRWLARWDDVEGVASRVPGLRAAYYVAEFRADEGSSAMAIGLRYSEAPDWAGCAVARRLLTTEGIARFGFPVYSWEGESTFEGIEVGEEMRSRLVSISRAPSGPAGLPMEIRLGATWSDRKLYQRLLYEERLGADDVGVGLTSVANRCGSEAVVIDATLNALLTPSPAHVEELYSPDVVSSQDGLTVHGTADASSAYLARFAPQWLNAGEALVVRLRIEQGSVGVGLMVEGVLRQYVVTPRHGLSVVVVQAAESGTYDPLIASADPGWRSDLRFTIDRLGIVTADGDVRPLQMRSVP